MASEAQDSEVAGRVIGGAMRVHGALGAGFLEAGDTLRPGVFSSDGGWREDFPSAEADGREGERRPGGHRARAGVGGRVESVRGPFVWYY